MDWDDLKHVAALAEAGSVRRAGAQLGVHGATVARHIERLEARLGLKLFARTPAGMMITDAGRRVLERYRLLAASLDELERALRADGPSLAGLVELFAAEALAAGWLIPLLGGFLSRYPDIELTVRIEPARPIPGAAQAMLVVTREPPGDLVGRRLGTLAIDAYRARPAGVLDRPTPAFGERLLGPVAQDFAEPWQAAGRSLPAVGPLHCPALAAQLEAARAGLGVALLPCVLGDAVAGLVGTAQPPLSAGDVWLLSHPDSRGIARLQALVGYVQEMWIADRSRLEGRAGMT